MSRKTKGRTHRDNQFNARLTNDEIHFVDALVLRFKNIRKTTVLSRIDLMLFGLRELDKRPDSDFDNHLL